MNNKDEGFPCCTVEYIYKEYTAAKKVSQAKGRDSTQDHLKRAMIVFISPKRFRVGGAAILATDNRNHQKVREGIDDCIPFIISILRDCVRS